MAAGSFLALDVGERRIGVAWADGALKIPFPLTTVAVTSQVVDELKKLCQEKEVAQLVVGFPRNQQGEATSQTEAVKAFAASLELLHIPVAFQDESLTSVQAEKELQQRGKPYTKEEVDSLAATYILQDYLQKVHA